MAEKITILETVELTKTFGGLTAVSHLSFSVQKGQLKAVIGPNGAGKTTIFNLITGTSNPSGGIVKFKGETITGLKPHMIARKGICRTFQTPRLFDNMTVLENVMVGRHIRAKAETLAAAFLFPAQRKEEKKIREDALEWLSFVGLGDKCGHPSESLSLGQRKLLQLARALATEPELLLLDEPAGGLNDSEKQDLVTVLSRVKDHWITVILVEHDMRFVMGLSDEVMVMNHGEKIAEGRPLEVQNNPEVVEAYLGANFVGVRNGPACLS